MRARFKKLLAETLIVNMKDGTSLSGVLWSDHGNALVLRNAQYHSGDDTVVDGEAIVLIENISFIQRPEPSTAVGRP